MITVYVLRSLKDSATYGGMASDATKRLKEHNHGKLFQASYIRSHNHSHRFKKNFK